MPVASQADNPTYATNEMCSILPSDETHVLAGDYHEHHEIAFDWRNSQGYDIWGQPCGELRYNTEFALDGYINGVITYRYTIVRNKCTGGRFRVYYPLVPGCIVPYGEADTDGDGILNVVDNYPYGTDKKKNLGLTSQSCQLVTQTDSPTNYATGNKYKRQVDFELNGATLPFGFTRYYNSQNEAEAFSGYGWTASYIENLSISGDTIVLIAANGTQIHFKDNGQGTFISEADIVRKIVAVTSGYTLTEPDGRTLSFDISGNLIQIADSNGNTQNITYTGGKISSVDDNFGRQITFQYNTQDQLSTLVTPVGDFLYRYDANNNLTRVDNPEGTFKTYIYDDPNDVHNLTGIIDERNIRVLTVAYDNEDRAIFSEGTNGHKRVDIVYNGAMTRQVTDSLGNITEIKLQEKYGIGRVKSSSGTGCGSCLASLGESYELNDRLQMSEETDGENNITQYPDYDDRGNVLTKIEAVGTDEERTTIYTYHPTYNFVATITRESVAKPGSKTVTTFTYDANGNLEDTTVTGYSEGAQTSISTGMTHNSYGQVIFMDGPRTDVADIVEYRYYPNEPAQSLNRGQLEKIIDPLSRETVFTDYTAFGKPQAVTDINGMVTTLVYDAAGRLTRSTRNGLTTVYGYDEIGQLETLDLPNGQQITYRYDDAGNNTRITDKLGNYIVYGYNSEGKRDRQEIHDAAGALKKYTDFQYDTVNRLWKTIYPDTTYAELLYDNNNQVTRLTDANGKVTDQLYDHLKRLEVVTQPGVTVTTYGYDVHDNLSSVTDAENLATVYHYDDFGRVEKEISPDTGTTTYRYDAAGNLTSKTDANGTVITYAYDILNRLTDVIFSDPSQDITYSYDEGANGLGRLTGMIDPSGTYVYGYDADGNLDSVQKTVAGVTYTTGYDYDAAGLLTGLTYPDGRTVTYARDDTGNVTAVTTTKDGLTRTVAATEASEVEVQVSTDAGRNLAGIRVYAFTDTGAYTGKYATTEDDGKATFALGEFADGDYKFRADYLGDRFWSPVIAVPGSLATAVTIAEETTTVQVTQGGTSKERVKVYLFNETGAYLGLYQTTDTNGEVSFVLPEGQEYMFRADITGGQFFSETATVVDGGTTVAINSGGGILTLNLSKGVDLPMEGIKTYLFTAGGSYLGHSSTSDALGQAGYAVPTGSYKIRADYLGYQFWTNVTGVTADTGINLEIPHQEVVITVNGDDDGDVQAREGLKTYLFAPSGSYLGINTTTDANGKVTFNLPVREYKVRADYLSRQFWSDVFMVQNKTITIPECRAEVLMTRLNNPLQGVPTYVFSESGSYLSLNGISAADGIVSYRLPAGTYNFRGDYLGSQYFSGNTVLVANQANPVAISTGGGNFTLTVEKASGEPMESIKCYLFTETGAYLCHTTTTNGQGEAPFELADGNYKIRTDYLGYQFWTPVFTVPDTGALTHTIAHSDVTITVEKQNGAVSEAVEGVKVYLFTSSGSYQGINSNTDAQGQVTFNLPATEYKVRADYLSGQYWSEVFNQADQTITVSEGTASITVSSGGTDLEGVNVYVFTAAGSYLGINGTTDVNGLVDFVVPAGDYKFRADYQGSQYWATETVTADQVNVIALNTGGGTFVLTVQKAAGVPMVDVPVYVFTPAGSYLGINARTDGSGQASFSLSEGSYMFRADYLGYQFWSNVNVVPGMLSYALTIAHTDVTVSVNEVYGVDSDPLEDINVYLFTESGAYQGQNAQTDVFGQVVFSLPDKAYKVRADYLGGQHWSEVFTSFDTAVDIAHGYANLHVTETGTDVVDAPVYLFTEAGSYLGRMQRTDAGGLTSFLIPAGAYKFRVDYGGRQYWSDVVNILADEETAVDLALDLLAMDGTRNPHPVRFDGTPPKREPVLLASLMSITGILNQSVVAATGPDALYWFINDHLGTPQKVVDADQAVVWGVSQAPFGDTTVSANTLNNKFRFPGQYFDTEPGLHYNYHRYYDPSLGRYLRPDPIGLAGGLNLFSYAHQNSISLIDPDGMIPLALPVYGIVKWGGAALVAAIPVKAVKETADAINDTSSSKSSAPCNKDPNSEKCRRLSEKIENLRKEIYEKRIPDLQNNPGNLPERIGPGEKLRDTVRGHHKLLNRQWRRLRELENRYDKECL